MSSVARVCSIEGCGRLVKAKGFCDPHWQRSRSGRDMNTPIREIKPGRTCSEPGCEAPYLAKGLCSRHYQTRWKGPKEPRKVFIGCVVSGCPEPHESLKLCSRHARTARNYKLSTAQLIYLYGIGCEVCKSTQNLVIDHDHSCCKSHRNSCGECVRGVLCSPCNTGIGHLKESVDNLLAAVSYLSSKV